MFLTTGEGAFPPSNAGVAQASEHSDSLQKQRVK